MCVYIKWCARGVQGGACMSHSLYSECGSVYVDVDVSGVVPPGCAGKNKTQVLNSDDEIALALKKNTGIYTHHSTHLSSPSRWWNSSFSLSLPTSPTQCSYSATEARLLLRSTNSLQ